MSLSLLLSQVLFGGLVTARITGILGNLTLLELMLLFLYGFIVVSLNTTRLRGDSTEEPHPVHVRLKTGDVVVPTKRRMVVVDDSDPKKEGKGFISLLCGVILLAEIVALALLTR